MMVLFFRRQNTRKERFLDYEYRNDAQHDGAGDDKVVLDLCIHTDSFAAAWNCCVLWTNVKNVVIRTIVKVYISIMRGTPLILQLMFIYFGRYYVLKMQMTPE